MKCKIYINEFSNILVYKSNHQACKSQHLFWGIDLQMILKNIVKKATKDSKSLDVIAKPINHINV